ncbi:MAG: hypothetical protein WC861_06185 [Candidatus Micrarchaeia archaeon]|jgi:hypothetical protein
MADAAKLMAKIDGKNARYKDYLVRQEHGTLSLKDRVSFNFRRYAKAGLKELPTFTKIKELGNEAAAYKQMHSDVLRDRNAQVALLGKELGMYRWLISLPADQERRSKSFLLGFNDLVSARKARGAVPSTSKVDTAGIANIMHQAAGEFEIAMESESLHNKNYTVDTTMLRNVITAMAEALVAEGKLPRLNIYQAAGAIVIKVMPHLNAHAIALLESAMPHVMQKPEGRCYVADENYDGGKGTFLYLAESK